MQEKTENLKELSIEDIQSLVHELRTHQIELEIQNEELRSTQSELEDERKKYTDLYDFAPIGYFTFDKKGLIINVNLTGANKLSKGRSFLIKTPFAFYVASSSKNLFYHHLYKVFSTNTKQTCEIKLIDKDKNQFDARLESLAVQDSRNNFNQCRTAIIDITEHKRSDEKISEQAELLDKAQDAIEVQDLEHRLIYWNKGAQQLYGWTAEEVIGKNADELLYKEKSPLLIEAKKGVIKRSEWIGELHQVTKDGKEIIVISRWSLVRDNEGKPKSILIINTDITEKKKLESQLLCAQRLESIGTLAGGIAHDLNNVLTPMMLSVETLKQKLKDEQSQKLLNILEDNSQRGADLIKQILSFARGVEGEHKPLQVIYIISEIEKVTKETFPKNIEIRTDIPKDLWIISGDATQLHQVIMNLCVNARDAMQDDGILSISAENLLVDENHARMYAEAKVGPYIVITVSDTGTGIPPEIIDRIFEPFFTTKEVGKGTGLGLSISLGIVKSHGGFIAVDSEVGKGTTFKVYLPAIKTEAQEAEEQLLELPVGNGELILLVDDEGSIREVTISTLEAYGYRVLTAEDGAQAVVSYTENIDKIKVVLMNMIMPVMDGHESIRAIRKINPEIKIIAVSGLANVADYTNAFLPKPYTTEKLLKTIHEVLSNH